VSPAERELKIPELPVVVGRGDEERVRGVQESRVTMTQLMAPQDTNLFGNVFGGVILAAVDRIAYVCATRHAGCPSVTVSIDQVDFRSPIDIGEIVTLVAEVSTVGRTSVEVCVQVWAESVTQSHERRLTNQCYVTMVAVDEHRHPVPVPRLRIETEAEYDRHHDALLRRAARVERATRRRPGEPAK
jgi:acyl-CoA hydrolase